MNRTVDSILKGKISIIQLKHGFRFGFDAVFLAAFVNGFLQKYKKKDVSLADIGSGVGTISLIIAYKNEKIKLTAIENNNQFLELAKENISNNNLKNQIKLLNSDIFKINKTLVNTLAQSCRVSRAPHARPSTFHGRSLVFQLLGRT